MTQAICVTSILIILLTPGNSFSKCWKFILQNHCVSKADLAFGKEIEHPNMRKAYWSI